MFTEIKRFWGVDLPALFFRSLATIPNALPQCWEVLAPHVRCGRLHGAALKLVGKIQLEIPAERFTLGQGEGCILSDADLAQIKTAIDSYNRANPQNLMAAAILAVNGANPLNGDPCQPLNGEIWSPPQTLMLSTKMMTVESIGANAMESIKRLTDFSAKSERTEHQPTLLPSLYRHLANFPVFLQFAAESMSSIAERQRLAVLIAEARKLAFSLAANEFSRTTGPHSKRVPFSDDVEDLIRRFLDRIPEMVVIGIFLRGVAECMKAN